MKKIKIFAMLMLFVPLAMWAQWTDVGNPYSINVHSSSDMEIHPITGEPHVAVVSSDDNFKVSVLKYNGSQWVYVGQAISAGQATSPQLEITSSGWIYVAYTDYSANQKATILRKSPSSSTFSTYFSGFTPADANGIRLYVDGGAYPTLVIVYEDNFSGVSAMWVSAATSYDLTQLGSRYFLGSGSGNFDLAVNGSKVGVSYTYNATAYVEEIDMANPSGGWQQVGGSILSSTVGGTRIDYNRSNDRWGVAVSQVINPSTSEFKVAVKEFDGTNWNFYGSVGLNGPTKGLPVAFAYHPINHIPYVLHKDYSQSGGTVSTFENGFWSTLGTAQYFTDLAVGRLKFHPDFYYPYVYNNRSYSSGSFEVDYYDDGCSRELDSEFENIYSPYSGMSSYQFQVYDIALNVTHTISGFNGNNYMRITQVPNWNYERTYQIRSRGYHPMFGWTGWSAYCYVATPEDPNGGGWGFGKRLDDDSETVVTLKGFEIYPNPSSGEVNITFGEAINKNDFALQIFSTAGQRVMSITPDLFDATGTATLNMEALPAGAYLLSGQVNGKSIRETLLKD
ncbi:MAG: T9SS type A sorting domain-containing protein [Owenweeksia sp.]